MFPLKLGRTPEGDHLVFQPSIFRCYVILLVSGGDGNSGIFPLKAHNSAFNVFRDPRSSIKNPQVPRWCYLTSFGRFGRRRKKRSKAAKGVSVFRRTVGFQGLERWAHHIPPGEKENHRLKSAFFGRNMHIKTLIC